jgi:hypothetical protein
MVLDGGPGCCGCVLASETDWNTHPVMGQAKLKVERETVTLSRLEAGMGLGIPLMGAAVGAGTFWCRKRTRRRIPSYTKGLQILLMSAAVCAGTFWCRK